MEAFNSGSFAKKRGIAMVPMRYEVRGRGQPHLTREGGVPVPARAPGAKEVGAGYHQGAHLPHH